MSAARILIVEDEGIVARDLRRSLERLGYQVVGLASTGEDAVTKAVEARPDLVLMDIRLGGSMDGVTAAQLIRKQQNLPVIYVTAFTDADTVNRAKVTEPFGYLLKPFEERELLAAIDMALYKHQMQKRLEDSERWLSATLRSIGDAVIATDPQGMIAFMNPVAERMTGWSQGDATGRPLDQVFKVVRESRRRSPENPAEEVLCEGVCEGPANGALLLSRSNGEIPIDDGAAPIKDDRGNVTGAVLVFQDITHRKRAEDAVRASRDQLRALAARLQAVREEERIRIAREVHDELGQWLTGLRFDVADLTQRLPAGEPALREKAMAIAEGIGKALRAVQTIAADLRPPVLDELGLAAAIEWQAQEFQRHYGIPCAVTTDLKENAMSPPCATALFRILQETLTNVARHAGASRVAVRLEETVDRLCLRIEDDGRGINESEITSPTSLGLMGIRERASMLGGTVRFEGRSGSGTTVTVEVPR